MEFLPRCSPYVPASLRFAALLFILGCWFAPHAASGQDGAEPKTGADTPAPTAPAKADPVAGARAFANCAGCHGRPDVSLPTGALWIERVAVTACVQPLGAPSAPTRASIIAYLKSDQGVPELVSKETAPSALEGKIKLGHPEKLTVLLVPEGAEGSPSDGDPSPVRVAWGSEQGEETRAIPAGRYRVRHYTMTRRDQSGEEWHLWASGRNGRTVIVSAGETTELLLDPRVLCRTTATQTGNGVKIGLAVTGDSGLGATVIRKGERVPVKYRLLGNGVVGKGGLPYG